MSLPIYLASSNVFFSAYSQSDFFGKLIFLGLFALSAICWIVLIQKIQQTKRVRKISTELQLSLNQKKDRILNVATDELPKFKGQSLSHPFLRILLELQTKTVEILNKNLYFSQTSNAYLTPSDIEIVESHVLTTISSETKKLEKNLFVLSTIVTLAPFLGLLGTVWGILITFAELHGGSAAGSNSAVLGGLSTALATTVLGLVIAIPALISYNYLKSSLKDLSSDMEDFLYLLLSTIEMQYRKVDEEPVRVK